MMFVRIFILLFFVVGSLVAQTPSFVHEWSTFLGDAYSEGDRISALCVDGTGGIFAAGTFGGPYADDRYVDLDTGAVKITQPDTEYGETDRVIIRLTASGALDWSVSLGGKYQDELCDITIHSNRLFLSGIQVSSESLNEKQTQGTLTALDATTGARVWPDIRFGELGQTNSLRAVVAMSDGGVVAVGGTTATNLAQRVEPALVNGTSYGLVHQGGLEAMVMRVSAAGEVLWIRYLGGKYDDEAYACALDADGNLFVAGETRSAGWASVPSGTPVTNRPSSFVTKLGVDGSHHWTALLTGNGAVSVRSLLCGAPGEMTLAGESSTEILQIGSQRPTSVKQPFAGGTDGFLLRLRETSEIPVPVWIRFFGGTGTDSLSSLAQDDQGRLAVAGVAGNGFFTPSAGALSYGGSRDGFLALLSETGDELLWQSFLGENMTDRAFAVAAASAGFVVGGETYSHGWVQYGINTTISRDLTDTAYGFLSYVAPPTPPVIEQDIQSVTVKEGESVTFTIRAMGTRPLSYAWYRDGTLLPSQETALTESFFAQDQNATLFCVVSNPYGATTSTVARVTVTGDPPTILTQPQDVTVLSGESVSFSVTATGGLSPLFFAWFKDDVKIPGAETNEWRQTATDAENGARFTCQVSNAFGVVMSDAARLTVTNTPVEPEPETGTYRMIQGRQVTIHVEPVADSLFWGVVETLPVGVEVVDAGGGVWYETTRQLVFTGSLAATLTYTVELRGAGPYEISGRFCPYGGVELAMGGDTLLRAFAMRFIYGPAITISVTPPSGATFWYMEEEIPAGLTPTELTGPGVTWNPDTRVVAWIATGDDAALCGYRLVGDAGTYTLAGMMQSGTAQEPVGGAGEVTLGGELPAIPTPAIQAFQRTNGVCLLRFCAFPGVTYSVQTNGQMNPEGWTEAWHCTAVEEEMALSFATEEPLLFIRISAQIPGQGE